MFSSNESFLKSQFADLSGDADWLLASFRLDDLLVLLLFWRLLLSSALEMFSPKSSFLLADGCDISVQIAPWRKPRVLLCFAGVRKNRRVKWR